MKGAAHASVQNAIKFGPGIITMGGDVGNPRVYRRDSNPSLSLSLSLRLRLSKRIVESAPASLSLKLRLSNGALRSTYTTAMSHTYELLERTLRPAGEDYESQVVYVDSRSGLIDPAVAELIESRGHVLLRHGGGTTVDAQPNDTNLHATLRARMRGLARPA